MRLVILLLSTSAASAITRAAVTEPTSDEGSRQDVGGSTPLEDANSCLILCAGFSSFGLQWIM